MVPATEEEPAGNEWGSSSAAKRLELTLRG